MLLFASAAMVFPHSGQTRTGDSMRRVTLICVLLLLLTSLVRAEPAIYELVRLDGQVVARTEAVPSVGDSYWDALSDEWYTVLSVEGTRATVGTPAETKRFFLLRNLRFAAGVAVLLTGAAWYARRKLRARRPA